MRELQESGLIEKVGRKGLVYEYEVIRDPQKVSEVKLRNAARLERQREHFGAHGRKGAAIKAARLASADDRAKKISPEGEEDFAPHEKHISPRTETLKQNLTNRPTKGQRERLDEQSEKEPGKDECIAKGESEYGSFSQSPAEAPSRRDGIVETHSNIDWNGWIEWLSQCQSRQEAILWIFEAIDQAKASLHLSSEDASELLDRVLRKGRATGLQPHPRNLNQLLSKAINSKKPTS